MSITPDAHDPSVGVRRRHLPSVAGEEPMTLYDAALAGPQQAAGFCLSTLGALVP